MNKQCVFGSVIALVVGLTMCTSAHQTRVDGPQVPQPQRWEFNVVTFPMDPKQATNQMNQLAIDGWEYVGLLNTSTPGISSTALREATGSADRPGHESLVAFRRPKK